MILASQSPRRRELLADAGIEFRAIASDFDEHLVSCDDPHELVLRLSAAKARAVERHALPHEPVIGSDTVVLLDGQVLGKPRDAADAAHMLGMLSGRTHEVATGVCVVVDGEEAVSFVSTAQVRFWDLSPEEIDAYVATGEPYDKAGAYGIQGKGRLLVRSIAGDYYAIVGLPIARLVRELKGHDLL